MKPALNALIASALSFLLAFATPFTAYAALEAGDASSDLGGESPDVAVVQDTTGTEGDGEGEGGGSGEDPEPEPEPDPEPVLTWQFERKSASDGYVAGWYVVGCDIAEGADPSEYESIEIPATTDAGQAVVGVAVKQGYSWSAFSAITLPDSVVEVHAGTFSGCADLASVTLGENSKLKTIGNEAFKASGIRELSLPPTVQTVGESAFSDAKQLTAMTFSTSSAKLSIGSSAFSGCSNLSVIALPECLTSIGDFTFKGCTSLSSIEVPASVNTICEGAFQGAGLAGSLALPALTTLEVSAFEGCSSLASVTVSENAPLTALPDKTFYGCEKLASASLPPTIESIGVEAFFGCKALQTVNFTNLTKLATIGKQAFVGSGFTSLTFPESLKMLDEAAFQESVSLKSVTFPSTSALRTLGKSAFYRCTSLASVALPETSSLATIWQFAFANTALAQVAIPSTVKALKLGAFEDCKQLKTVTGCEGLETIDSLAFGGSGVMSFPFTAPKLKYVDKDAFADSPLYADMSKFSEGDLHEQGGGYYRYDATVQITGSANYDLAASALAELNSYRTSAGLTSNAELAVDANLQKAAMLRAAELSIRYASKRPIDLDFDTVPGKLAEKAKYQAFSAGQVTASGALTALVSNTANKAAFEDAGYKSVGIGCFQQSGTYYWVVLLSDEAADGEGVVTEGTVTETHVVGLLADKYLPVLEIAPIADKSILKADESTKLQVMCRSSIRYSAELDIPSTVVFYSRYPEVATVDATTGLVTFKKSGTAEIRVSLLGLENNQDIIASSVYSIAPKDNVKDAKITGIVNKTYTGSKIKQDITVTYGKKTLKLNTDYKVSYSKNTNVGTATATITGVGKYEGTMNKTFKITQAAQPLKLTALAKVTTAKSKAFAFVKATSAKGTVTYYNKSTS